VNRQGKLSGRLVEDKIFGTPARSFAPAACAAIVEREEKNTRCWTITVGNASFKARLAKGPIVLCMTIGTGQEQAGQE